MEMNKSRTNFDAGELKPIAVQGPEGCRGGASLTRIEAGESQKRFLQVRGGRWEEGGAFAREG